MSKQATTVHNRPINLWTNIFRQMMACSNLIAKVEVEKDKRADIWVAHPNLGNLGPAYKFYCPIVQTKAEVRSRLLLCTAVPNFVYFSLSKSP